MKITIWIRPADEGRTTTLRLDAKYETHDTPFIQRMGRKLMDAIEGTTDKAQVCGEGEVAS